MSPQTIDFNCTRDIIEDEPVKVDKFRLITICKKIVSIFKSLIINYITSL